MRCFGLLRSFETLSQIRLFKTLFLTFRQANKRRHSPRWYKVKDWEQGQHSQLKTQVDNTQTTQGLRSKPFIELTFKNVYKTNKAEQQLILLKMF